MPTQTKKQDPIVLALTALAQVSFYARINHGTKCDDYGQVVDGALKAFGLPTGDYLDAEQVEVALGAINKQDSLKDACALEAAWLDSVLRRWTLPAALTKQVVTRAAALRAVVAKTEER